MLESRFGEPLDVDGDGVADVVAGGRFGREGPDHVGYVAVWSGASGERIRTWKEELRNGLFGHWTLLIPDISGDRLADVVITAPQTVVEGAGGGVVLARSPKTGNEIWRLPGRPDDQLGWDVAAAGDRDGDGYVDLFIGSPGSSGHVYLVSGRHGSVLRTYAPRVEEPTFGWYIAPIDDIDADGENDLAVGAFNERNEAQQATGAAYILSAKSGEQLHHWIGADAGSSFGDTLVAVADSDGDGRRDLAVSAPRTADSTRTRPGEVTVYSSVTYKPLRTWSGSQPGELFGRQLAGAGDLDSDGVDDIAIGAPWHKRGDGDRTGRVELRSGKSGAVLYELVGDGPDCWFGWHIRRAPDPEGHGRPALLIGSLRHPVDGQPGVGVVDLYVLQRPRP